MLHLKYYQFNAVHQDVLSNTVLRETDASLCSILQL